MNFYSEYKLYPNKSSELYKAPFFKDEIPMTEVLSFSQNADMKPLSISDIYGHPFGFGMVGTWYSGHGFAHRDVLTYAGITGFENRDGKKLAVVGGLITHPDARKRGFGNLTVGWLLSNAMLGKSIIDYGHDGFTANCNDMSMQLLKEHHGFTKIDEENGKHVMTLLIDPDFVLRMKNSTRYYLSKN